MVAFPLVDVGPKAVYTVPELATLSGLSRFQVGRLLARNDVQVVRAGRRTLVPLAALRAALPWMVDSLREVSGLATREHLFSSRWCASCVSFGNRGVS